MAKNKGLTPKRKKIDRNPRVKNREKFRRAKIRRKGQVCVMWFLFYKRFHISLFSPIFDASHAIQHWNLFISARCAMFVGRIKNTAGSCLASALVSRKAPNSSKNEWKHQWTYLEHLMSELFSILKRTPIIAINKHFLNTHHFLYHLYQPT